MEEELAGDVDFDFFDDEEGKQSSKKSDSPSSPAVKGKPPTPTSSLSKTATSQNGYRMEKRNVNQTERDDYSSDDSASENYSSDYESDDDKKKMRTIKATVPTGDTVGRRNSPRSKTRNSTRRSGSESDNSDKGSSSAYSDGSEDDQSPARSPSPKSSSKTRKEAWNTESKNTSSKSKVNSNRPKSSHPRNGRSENVMRNTVKTKPQPRCSGSNSASDSNSNSDSHTSDSDTDSSCSKSTSHTSGSDSEITDVSPLQSADSSPVLKRKHQKHVAIISAPQKDYRLYKELPNTSYHEHSKDKLPPTAAETMEFKLLMQAVAELDNEKQQRLKSSSRRVMFEPPKAGQNRDKGNYSFSNTQVKQIELENERLLEEIMRKRLQKKKKESAVISPPAARRMPNSAVNRFKDQRRIELENLAFLKRLQRIKPTKGITRNEQLHDYRRQMLYGVPSNMSKLDTLSERSKSPYQRSMERTRSMSSVHSAATTTSLASNSASSCRSSRPQSAKKVHVDPRPVWDGRW